MRLKQVWGFFVEEEGNLGGQCQSSGIQEATSEAFSGREGFTWRGVRLLGRDNCTAVTSVVGLIRIYCSLRLMRPLCYDQPETLTRGYYPGVDSMAINAALLRRESS